MAFMRNINDFILTLVALSLPSIAATIDCNGKPFHCLNSTHFMICVDFGSGVSSTMDDFVILCPPTTVCQATNRFECEFPTVTTTTVTSVVTNSPLAATVNNDVVIDTVSDVTTIPFEEYFNTLSTTTLSEGNLMTRDAVTTELPVNNLYVSFNVPATDSNINESAIDVGVSPNYFTTLATLDIVTDETTVTERIPNVAENVNVIFEPNSNISKVFPNATEIVPTDIDLINLSENYTVDVTESYDSNSTLLETIIGATNFSQFNTPLYNSTSYNVTEPILSEATESIPIDDKQVYLTTLVASPDVVLDNRTIEHVTESILTKTTEYKHLTQFQSKSTLNETMSTDDIVKNYTNTFNTAHDINGYALNVNHSDVSFNEITTKYEKQISTAQPILFEVKETTNKIPVDEQVYLPTLDASLDVFLDDQTIDNTTESIPAETTVYKHLKESQGGNRFNNKPLDNSTLYNITEPILPEVTESTISIPVDDKQAYLSTLDALPDVIMSDQTIDNVPETVLAVTTDYKHLTESQSNRFSNKPHDSSTLYIIEPILSNVTKSVISIPVDNKQAYLSKLAASPNMVWGDQTIDNVTETVLEVTTDYKHLTESQSNSALNKTMSGGDIVQNDTTKLNTLLEPNESATNVDNSDSYFSEMTTNYKEQEEMNTAEPILYQAKENTINILVDDKQAYLTTLDVSPDVFLDDQTIDTATESIPAETTKYKHLIQSQSNSTLYETISDGDIVQNDTTSLNTVVNTNESALNVNNSDSYFTDITTKYEEQISTAEPILKEAKVNELEDKQDFLTTLNGSPDVFLDNKPTDTVTESIPTSIYTTEYRDSIESQSNSLLNATMSSGDIEHSYTTTVKTVVNTNGSASNVHNSNLSLNKGTATYYDEQISTAQNDFELSGNTGTEITQPDVTELTYITKPKVSVSTIATSTVNTEPLSTNTLNVAINTDVAGPVTVKLNVLVIESGKKTNIFDDMQTTEFSFNDSNHHPNVTEDFVTSTSNNRSVKPENNTNTTPSENLTGVNYVEIFKKTETETEDIHSVLPKPPRSNETTTIVHGNHSLADNTSTTYTIYNNMNTIITQNKRKLNDISARIDEAQRVLTSEVNVNDRTTEDATENNHLLKPVMEPTSTPLLNNAHNVLGSDLTNEKLQEMSTFINNIELTARGNVANVTLTQNVTGSNMIKSTEISETPSNHIELNNRVNVSTADDQINTVEISESTSNGTYSNLYYHTDIEEISHDQEVPRNNILSAATIESTSSILVLTTESTKEPHFDAVLLATTLNSVGDKMYIAESVNYLASTTNSPQPEATPSTAFDSINSAVDTSKLVTRENEVEEISTASSKLDITSPINDNSYLATEQNISTTDITNSPQQTTITSSTAFVNTNSAENQVKQVTRHVVDEKISTEPSMLLISFTLNETAYVATEQNIPSAEATPEPADLIPDRFNYSTTNEPANDSAHQEARITITSDSSTTKPSDSSALQAQNNREIKETLPAITTTKTSTDSSAIPNLMVSNLSGVSNFGEEINVITVVDSLTTETTEDAISKASTNNVLEKYPINIKKEDINPENIRNSIKINTTTKYITVKEDTNHTKPLSSYSIQRENISKLAIMSDLTDQTTLASFVADDVNYSENFKLADTQDRKLSEAHAAPNIPEILPERFRAIVYDSNSSVNKAIDGTSITNAVAADTKLVRDENNEQSTKKFVTTKISVTETLLYETLKEKDVMSVIPELKSNSETKLKIPKQYGDINTNPIITTETSSFKSHTERKLSFTTSIQDSKYQSNLAPSTESWRATVHPTRPYTETFITSSKAYTESNDKMSQKVTSLTPKLNLANPAEKQYINPIQNIEPAPKNVLTSLEPSVILPQVTEPRGVANQDVQSTSVRKSTTQKPYGIDTLKQVQNQEVSSTEKYLINVTPLARGNARGIITKPVDLSTRQSFTAPNTQILPENHVFKNGEQIEVPTTEKLKGYVIPIVSPSVKVKSEGKPSVDVTAVPILKSSNNISKEGMPNTKAHPITTVYNSNLTVKSVLITEINKVQLNITSTTEKTMTQSSDLDIVMVDVVNTNSPNLREIATGSNDTHSGILAIKKSTSQQVQKHKAITSVTENENESKKEEKPEIEMEETKPEVAETNPFNGKIEHITSTASIPIKKQANVQPNPTINTKQKPVLNVTTRTRPVDTHVKNTSARYNTKTKSSVTNTQNSTHPAAETTKHNVVCKSNNRGRFSDNGDCRKFYICIGKHEPIKGICPNNTVFSELRKQCTKNLSHCVRNNQFQCVSEGRFRDYLNDNIYYICVNNKANRFIRFKLQCQNGYYLNKTSVRCVMNTESIIFTSQQSQQSKTASDVSTSNQSTSAKSEKIMEKPKTNKKFECKRSGKFPEPNDCRKYYVCTKLGKSEYRQRSKKCDSDEVYNRNKKKCVDADSYECR